MSGQIGGDLVSAGRSNDVIAEKKVTDEFVMFEAGHQASDMLWTNNPVHRGQRINEVADLR